MESTAYDQEFDVTTTGAPPMTMGSRIRDFRYRHPVIFYGSVSVVGFAIIRVISNLLRRRCADAQGRRDPTKATNLACRIQRPMDVIAMMPERIIGAFSKTRQYDVDTGKLVPISPTTNLAPNPLLPFIPGTQAGVGFQA